MFNFRKTLIRLINKLNFQLKKIAKAEVFAKYLKKTSNFYLEFIFQTCF